MVEFAPPPSSLGNSAADVRTYSVSCLFPSINWSQRPCASIVHAKYPIWSQASDAFVWWWNASHNEEIVIARGCMAGSGGCADLWWPPDWSSGPGCLPMTMHCKYAATGADFCYRSYASMGHQGAGRVGGVLWPAAFHDDALAMQLPLISTAMQCDWNML